MYCLDTFLTVLWYKDGPSNDREIFNACSSWALSSSLSIEQFICSSVTWPRITGAIVRHSKKDLFCICQKWTICTLCWVGTAKHSSCSWAIALDLWLQFKERWRGSCLNAVCDAQWSRWRETLMTSRKSTSALWELRLKPGSLVLVWEDPSIWPVQVSPWGCGMQACALPDGQAATGLSGCLLEGMRTILRICCWDSLSYSCSVIASTATTVFTSPLNGDFLPFWWVSLASPEQQVASTRLIHICSWRPL